MRAQGLRSSTTLSFALPSQLLRDAVLDFPAGEQTYEINPKTKTAAPPSTQTLALRSCRCWIGGAPI